MHRREQAISVFACEVPVYRDAILVEGNGHCNSLFGCGSLSKHWEIHAYVERRRQNFLSAFASTVHAHRVNAFSSQCVAAAPRSSVKFG